MAAATTTTCGSVAARPKPPAGAATFWMTRSSLTALAWGAFLAPACAQTTADEARRARIEDLAREIRADYPEVGTITASALSDALREGEIVLVDVRTDREREVSTLPGAISRDAFESRIAEFAGRTVVAYCTIGARSSSYAREMGRRGIDVLNLEGSVLAWTHAAGELRTADGAATRRVHVYGRRWNLVARGYEAIW